ncbi:MAG TPA: hypothetical protein VHX88_07725 [Solirubrobacteraceae bacterium]|nr:hypothetical protein [Solirubrobacteraceae bacterium]
MHGAPHGGGEGGGPQAELLAELVLSGHGPVAVVPVVVVGGTQAGVEAALAAPVALATTHGPHGVHGGGTGQAPVAEVEPLLSAVTQQAITTLPELDEDVSVAGGTHGGGTGQVVLLVVPLAGVTQQAGPPVVAPVLDVPRGTGHGGGVGQLVLDVLVPLAKMHGGGRQAAVVVPVAVGGTHRHTMVLVLVAVGATQWQTVIVVLVPGGYRQWQTAVDGAAGVTQGGTHGGVVGLRFWCLVLRWWRRLR